MVKGQRKKSKSKSKSTGPGQSQRILVRVGSGFPGQVTGRAVDPMTSSYDMSLTCLMTCLGLTWLLTSSSDVSSSVSARGRRMLSPPAREGDAGNPGGAWGRMRRRMTTRFSRQVDRWTTRLSGRRVDQEDDLEVRNLRRCVGFFRRQLRRVARLRVTGFLGFPYGRPRSTPVWLVSSGDGLICTDL